MFLLGTVGCRTSGGPATAPRVAVSDSPSVPNGFVRSIDGPFEVRDPDGRPFQHPYLGGFNVPRPQLLDIDGDGDTDLFIQEIHDAVMFFENVGTAADGRYEFRSEKYGEIDVGEWYRFADLDDDGDFDLLAERPFSYVRYLRNEGSPTEPRFVEAADSLTDTSGEPLFSDRQNIPNVTDIDCDGRPDLFIGRLEGTVTRYESAGEPGDPLPTFRFVQDRFQGIEIIGQILGSLHGANTLAFADLDDDGDRDLLWGDYFEPGLLLIENTGSCTVPKLTGEPQPFPEENPLRTSGYNAPAPGDMDGDGDLDLLVGVLGGAFNANTTTADNLYQFEQTAPGEFVQRAKRFMYTVDVGSESVPAVGDLDGDGDPDLLLSNQIEPADNKTSGMYWFEMRSEGEARYWQLVDTLRFAPAYHYSPALGDLDADGDLDMIVGTWRDELSWYRNTGRVGKDRYELAGESVVKLTRGSNAAPALVDIDADGDLDLFVGETSGTLNFYRNDGSAREPQFIFLDDEYARIDVGRRSFPAFTDLDGDGDFDLVLGRASGGAFVHLNRGSKTSPDFNAVADVDPTGFAGSVSRLPLPDHSTPVFFDADGDGDLDVMSGSGGGGMVLYISDLVSQKSDR